jgi:hypothetical protein
VPVPTLIAINSLEQLNTVKLLQELLVTLST